MTADRIDEENAGCVVARVMCPTGNNLEAEDKLARAEVIDVSKLSGDTIKCHGDIDQ
jgi:hypothetical protein